MAEPRKKAKRGEAPPLDRRDVDRIITELRESANAAFMAASMISRSETAEHAKNLAATIAECYAHAGAALARYDSLMLNHDGTLPMRLKLERRMALALDLMNIDPFALEAKSNEKAEEAAYERVKARAKRTRGG